MPVFISICTCVRACVRVYISTHVHLHMYMYLCIYLHTYIYTYIHLYLYQSICLSIYRTDWPCERFSCGISTGWRRCIGCLKMQASFRNRAMNYRARWCKMTHKDKASYVLSPPSTMNWTVESRTIFTAETGTILTAVHEYAIKIYSTSLHNTQIQWRIHARTRTFFVLPRFLLGCLVCHCCHNLWTAAVQISTDFPDSIPGPRSWRPSLCLTKHTVSAQEYHAGCAARGCACVAQYCVMRHAQRREHVYSAGGHKQGPHKTVSAVHWSGIAANTSRDAPVSAAKNTSEESPAIIEHQCCGFGFRTGPRLSKERNEQTVLLLCAYHVDLLQCVEVCCSVLQCVAVWSVIYASPTDFFTNLPLRPLFKKRHPA